MSWSVLEEVSVQTITDMPLDELALSDSNWALAVLVFTKKSLERRHRPSSRVMPGRNLRHFERGADMMRPPGVRDCCDSRAVCRGVLPTPPGTQQRGRKPNTSRPRFQPAPRQPPGGGAHACA